MIGRVETIFRQRGYRLQTKPYELNILGIRSPETRANRFDDEIHVFYKNSKGTWDYHIFKATTDPGTFWLKNPSSPQGTAILAPGQYKDAYQIGRHQNTYKALVQRGPVNIIRDYDRNAWLDFLKGKPQHGMFGINIHRAFANGTAKTVDRFSAGCQVFANTADFQRFLAMCDKHQSLYGNKFSYTLIDLRAIRKETVRRIVLGTLAAILTFSGFYYYYATKNS